MVEMTKLDSPKTIWVLLAELAKQQGNLGSHGQNEKAKRLRREIAARFTPIQFELLERASETDQSAFPSAMYLHLPPDEKGGQPVLRVSFDTKNGHTVLRIRAAILVEHEEENECGEMKLVHRGIGIRFEGPEGAKGTSTHDYAHAQWFSSFERNTEALPGCPPWLPESHPAIPIPAENAVDILCCALKSFYGSKSEPLQWLAKKVIARDAVHVVGVETRDRIKCWVGAS